MVVVDELVVRFRPEVTRSRALELLGGHELLSENELGENTYHVRVRAEHASQVLAEAGRLGRLGEVAYAQPNFLRIVEPELTRGGAAPREVALTRSGSPFLSVLLDPNLEPFPGPRWTVSGEPTWGTVPLPTGGQGVWPAAAGPGATDPSQWLPPEFDAVMEAGPFDLSASEYPTLLLRFGNFDPAEIDPFASITVTATSGAGSFTSMNLVDRVSFDFFLSSLFGLDLLPPGETISWRLSLFDELDLGDHRGQSDVRLQIRYQGGGFFPVPGFYLSRVELNQPQLPVTPLSDDPLSPLAWHLRNTGQLGGTPGVDIGFGQSGIFGATHTDLIVAVLDGGVDTEHEDLSTVPGYVPVESLPGDLAHGTSVAGLIGALGNNGLGGIGVAPGVKIMPLLLSTTDVEIAAGIRFAVDQGARIINNSWGADLPTEVLAEAFEYAHSQGVTVLAAVGNGGFPKVQFPANLPTVIAVGASSMGDEPQSYYDCSGYLFPTGYGPELDLVAPGAFLVAPYPGDDYIYTFGATSGATPIVTGVVARMLSLRPQLTPDEIREILTTTAFNPLTGQRTTGRIDDRLGWGRVDLYAALVEVAARYPQPPANLPGGEWTPPQVAGGSSPPASNVPDSGSDTMCFIATAAYGSPLDPHVATLRAFRDRWLLTNAPGRLAVGLYYRYSPSLATLVADSSVLRLATRAALTPVVLGLEHPLAAVMLGIGLFGLGLRLRRRRAAH